MTPGAARPAGLRATFGAVRSRAQETLIWQVWERMLEIEFVDRSVALAGKAFVSFFPLVIVVAAFMPPGVRASIFTTLTHQLGIQGASLATAKEAFSSADDIRRAAGVLGLTLTVFFATSFTTALQRVYLRAWRREPGGKVSQYVRGPVWLIVMLAYMAMLGAVRGQAGESAGFGLFVLFALASSSALWLFTAWFLLLGHVRPRVLAPTGLITGLAMSGYAFAATVWMPEVVSRNEAQYGFFGVALALVSWFSGASICVLVGACAGPVLAGDAGRIGELIRGANPELLIEGAPPPLAPPETPLRLRDAFRPVEEHVSDAPPGAGPPSPTGDTPPGPVE